MKVLVTYFSKTGNTEKLSKAIYDGVKQLEKEIKSIEEVGDLGQYHLVFCGFPVQASSVPHKAAELLKKIPADCETAIFATHGSLRGGRLAVTALEHAASLVKGKVLGTFGCRGAWALRHCDRTGDACPPCPAIDGAWRTQRVEGMSVLIR